MVNIRSKTFFFTLDFLRDFFFHSGIFVVADLDDVREVESGTPKPKNDPVAICTAPQANDFSLCKGGNMLGAKNCIFPSVNARMLRFVG